MFTLRLPARDRQYTSHISRRNVQQRVSNLIIRIQKTSPRNIWVPGRTHTTHSRPCRRARTTHTHMYTRAYTGTHARPYHFTGRDRQVSSTQRHPLTADISCNILGLMSYQFKYTQCICFIVFTWDVLLRTMIHATLRMTRMWRSGWGLSLQGLGGTVKQYLYPPSRPSFPRPAQAQPIPTKWTWRAAAIREQIL